MDRSYVEKDQEEMESKRPRRQRNRACAFCTICESSDREDILAKLLAASDMNLLAKFLLEYKNASRNVLYNRVDVDVQANIASFLNEFLIHDLESFIYAFTYPFPYLRIVISTDLNGRLGQLLLEVLELNHPKLRELKVSVLGQGNNVKFDDNVKLLCELIQKSSVLRVCDVNIGGLKPDHFYWLSRLMDKGSCCTMRMYIQSDLEGMDVGHIEMDEYFCTSYDWIYALTIEIAADTLKILDHVSQRSTKLQSLIVTKLFKQTSHIPNTPSASQRKTLENSSSEVVSGCLPVFIKNNKELTYISICDQNMNREQKKRTVEALFQSENSLKTAALRNVNLDDDDCKYIFTQLRNNKRLKAINLSANASIGDETGKFLYDCIQDDQIRLRHIDLDHSGMSQDVLGRLGKVANSKGIQVR